MRFFEKQSVAPLKFKHLFHTGNTLLGAGAGAVVSDDKLTGALIGGAAGGAGSFGLRKLMKGNTQLLGSMRTTIDSPKKALEISKSFAGRLRDIAKSKK